MLKLNHNRFVALVALLAVASLTILFVLEACARQGKDSVASQGQKANRATAAKIQLNEDDMGMSSDTSVLSKKLEDIFKMRKEQHAFKIGFERRTDLRLDDMIEKTVFVKADRAIQLEEVTKVIEATEDSGAEPILLPIVDPSEYSGKKPDWMGMRTGKMNPLTLLVRAVQPNSPPPAEAASNDYFISGGIPIVLSSITTNKSSAVITITRDGDYTLGENRIEKAALENGIRDRIKAQPEAGQVVAIKCSPGITYGSLEDIYRAAFAAGAKRIALDTGEKTISWEEQGMRFVLPTGWRRTTFPASVADSFRFKGPDDGRLSVEVLDKREPDDVESALRKEYEFQLGRHQKGENEEARYLELDGAKGLLLRYASEEDMVLSWQGYRQIRGKQQFVSISLSIRLNGFNKRREELNDILNSIKLTQN